VDLVAPRDDDELPALEQVAFAGPYYISYLKLLVRQDDTVKSLRERRAKGEKDLRDQRVDDARQGVERQGRQARRRSPDTPTAWCSGSRVRSTRSPRDDAILAA
jgi:ABC-type amino acid transport substrate-binding protein